jgi:hypothetical protein
MRDVFNITSLGVALILLALPAAADWDPGDGHKMHYPQMPDPFGLDVSFRSPQVLADDWQCSATGPVDDVHFWFSAQGGATPNIFSVHLSIHENLPPDPANPFSRPGALLWQRDFSPTEFTWRFAGTGEQGWYVPENGVYIPNDHFEFYQMNIENIPAPFTQLQGEVYWLDISISAQTPLGWKTSMSPQFMDTGVWGNLPAPTWQPVYDPRVPGAQMPLDFAFVITPEPSAIVLMCLGGLGVLRRRW